MPLKSFKNPNSDEARQYLLDRRGGRTHPKRHRTRKSAIRVSEAKRQKRKSAATEQKAKRARLLSLAQAYWRGEGDHP